MFYNMYKKQGRILATKTGAAEDVEAAVKTDEVKNGQMMVVSRDDPSLGRLEIEEGAFDEDVVNLMSFPGFDS